MEGKSESEKHSLQAEDLTPIFCIIKLVNLLLKDLIEKARKL